MPDWWTWYYNCCQIPILLEKEPDLDQQGNPVFEPDGKQRYRCGFRIGGGIDQDPSQSPQGYPDKVSTLELRCWSVWQSKLVFYYKSLCLEIHAGVTLNLSDLHQFMHNMSCFVSVVWKMHRAKPTLQSAHKKNEKDVIVDLGVLMI